MKKYLIIFFITLVISLAFNDAVAQCAMCTKTAQQLGEKPALGLNKAILYLMISPFAIIGVIGFRWWKNNKRMEDEELKQQQQ